jgi:hypothetical protein
MRRCSIPTVLALALAVLLASSAARPSAASAPVRDEVASLFVEPLPAGAREIADAMTTAKVGDTIVLRGTVARSKDAFVPKRAIFTLVDESTSKGCCPQEGELPETACDIPPEGKATIQILDANGRPLRRDLNGTKGLVPGAEVFVTGSVVAANGKDTLVVRATAFHVPKSSLPSTFFSATAPEGARDVSEARSASAHGTHKVGDTIVLRGRIGGSREPFVAGRAMFTLVGSGLKACSDRPDDACTTPWDYCCETKEAIALHSATIEVLDAQKKVLRTDLKGRRGLKELSEVVVTGTIAAVNEKTLVVAATSMHVVR